MDKLASYQVFVRVAESRSFSAVAREMGVTQPAVSRIVGALEEHLGTRLVHRNTRGLTLTSDGASVLDHAREILEAVNRAEEAVGGRQADVAGLVRLAAGSTFGRVTLAPLLGRMLALHPGLEVDLRLSDTMPDMVRDGIDLAVRLGQPADPTLVMKRLGTVWQAVMGSVSYLEAHGMPYTLDDLSWHQCVILDQSANPTTWRLTNGTESRDVSVKGRFRTDSVEANRVAVSAGLGLGLVSGWLMHEELEEGTVRVVLPEWGAPPVSLNAFYPSRRHLASRTRAVVDFLTEEMRSNPTLAGLRRLR